jgi:uncharacterized protein (TIGR02145 family)
VYYNGSFYDQGVFGHWWSSSEYSSATRAYFLYVDFSDVDPQGVSSMYHGSAVRCLKD